MREVLSQPCVVQVRDAAASAGLRLQARYSPGEHGGAVVAPPHPLYGGTLDNPVAVACARGLHHAGLATLVFNYRGVEGSEGKATEDLAAAVDDYAAALDHLAAQTQGPYFAAGYSFGAGTAVLRACSDARVAGLVLIAPPIGMLRAEDLDAFAGPVLVIVGADDEFAPLPELTAMLGSRPKCTLQVLTNVDHFFHFGGLHELDQRVCAHVSAWLKRA